MHTAARGSKKIAIFHIVPTFSRSAAVICSVRAAVGNGDARYQVSIIGAKQKPTASVFAFPTAKVTMRRSFCRWKKSICVYIASKQLRWFVDIKLVTALF
jgi:hypothetical protein